MNKKRTNSRRVEKLVRTTIEVSEKLWQWIDERCIAMKASKRVTIERWIKKGIRQELEFPKIMADLSLSLSELHTKYNDEYWREKIDANRGSGNTYIR